VGDWIDFVARGEGAQEEGGGRDEGEGWRGCAWLKVMARYPLVHDMCPVFVVRVETDFDGK